MAGRVTPFNSVDASSSDVDAPSTANTQAQRTYAAAGFGVSHLITGIAWSYSGAPIGGRLQITDNNFTVFDIDITAAGPGSVVFPLPKRGAANTALVITLAAGGAGVFGKLSVLGHWTE